MWTWMIQEGLYRDILAAFVAMAITTLFAWRPFRSLKTNAKKTSDMLDTSTPGGLTDVMNAILSSEKPNRISGDDKGGT